MSVDLLPTVLVASGAAFGLPELSAVAGFGGGVLPLPVFTVLFRLRAAVPILTLTQLSSNESRGLTQPTRPALALIGWFALGAVPCGGDRRTGTRAAPLTRLLGIFLITVVLWRRLNRHPRHLAEPAFTAVGAASGLGSALLGSVGPLTAPFFLAAGLTRAAYIGTEAASALTMHLTKIATYSAGDLLTTLVQSLTCLLGCCR